MAVLPERVPIRYNEHEHVISASFNVSAGNQGIIKRRGGDLMMMTYPGSLPKAMGPLP